MSLALQTVHKLRVIRPFLEAARRRRVDIAIVGDSNTYSAGTSGNAVGYQYAWGKRFGQYATGVHQMATGGGEGLDYQVSFGGLNGNPFNATVPDAYLPFALPVNCGVGTGVYLSGTLAYMDEDAASMLSVTGVTTEPRRFHFGYGTFASGPSKFWPCVYVSGTGYFPVVGTTKSAVTGSVGHAYGYIDVPIDTTRAQVTLLRYGPYSYYSVGSQEVPVGPLYFSTSRMEWTDVTRGTSVSALCYHGGQPTRAAAGALQACTLAQLGSWLTAMVRIQNGRPTAMLNILQGQNDTADHVLSVGPHPAYGDTPSGVVDNTEAVIIRVRAAWAALGYDLADLFILLGPYHPQNYSRDQWGQDLDAAYEAYADREDNVAVATRSRLSTSAYFTAKNRYAGSYPDDAHLNAQGYLDWAGEVISAIAPEPNVLVSYASGNYLDGKIFDASGQVFDAVTGAFGQWVDERIISYAVRCSELGNSGLYRFVLPPFLRKAGQLRIVITQRLDGDADPALEDPYVETKTLDFDGLGVSTVTEIGASAGVVDSIDGGTITPKAFATPTLTAGPATDVVGMVAQLHHKAYGKLVFDEAAHTVKSYAADGTTVLTTQSLAKSGSVQVQGAAT